MSNRRSNFCSKVIQVFLCLLLVMTLGNFLTGNKAMASAAPKEPGLVSLKESGTTGAVLIWKKVSGASGYCIYRHEEGEKWSKIKILKGSAVIKYTDKNLTPGKKYYYTVRSYKKSGTKTIYSTYSKTGLSMISGLSSIKINKTALTLDQNKTYTLKLSGTSVRPVWKSGNTKIVKISSSGKLTALSAGKTKVSATIAGKKYYCTVMVRPLFRVSETSITLEQDNTGYVVFTSEYPGEKFKAANTKSSVVSCRWGGWNMDDNTLYITAKKVGTADITVTSISGRKITVHVTVTSIF